jgi:hypothetical protein
MFKKYMLKNIFEILNIYFSKKNIQNIFKILTIYNTQENIFMFGQNISITIKHKHHN